MSDTAPLTNSALQALGKRWREDRASAEDMARIRSFIIGHLDPMRKVSDAVQRLGFAPSSRLKTEQTLLMKLNRNHARLSTIDDIAGVRVVLPGGLAQQDELAQRLVEEFPEARVVDRRENPSHGYRAIHIIAVVDNQRVEIQLRTSLQHQWAQVMERLADGWGRQIRYGDLPDSPDSPVEGSGKPRSEVVAGIIALSDRVADYENGRVASRNDNELEVAATTCVLGLRHAYDAMKDVQTLADREAGRLVATTGSEKVSQLL